MKKHKRHHLTPKMTLLAGATATAMLATQATPAHAEVAGDTLINKLEQKGILTTEEAKQLREENQQEYNNSFTNNFDKAFGKITGTPSWVTGYKISGDFRGRYEQFQAPDNNHYSDRTRFRYRLRFGIVANILDNMEVGFRLASGDPAQGTSGQGNPVSENTTMQNNATSKNIYIDQAFAKWTAINNDEWLMAATIGKMANPFQSLQMVFDPDYNPEGAAITGSYTINDKHSLAFTGAAFVLDEESGTTHDPFLFGGQVALNSKWNDKLSSSLGFGAFSIMNPNQLTTGNVPYQNQGNTRVGGVLVNNYNPLVADASVTYTFDSAPLYPGKFPVKLGGEFIDNPSAGDNNKGYWVGVTLGKAGKKHTWDFSYRYEQLEADAWYDQIVDDDMSVYYQNAPSSGSAGMYGGTNVKGHLTKFNYSITDSLTLTLTCYITDLVNNNVYNNVNEPNSTAIHAMADLMWKF